VGREKERKEVKLRHGTSGAIGFDGDDGVEGSSKGDE
jgi:hypothetical protein